MDDFWLNRNKGMVHLLSLISDCRSLHPTKNYNILPQMCPKKCKKASYNLELMIINDPFPNQILRTDPDAN